MLESIHCSYIAIFIITSVFLYRAIQRPFQFKNLLIVETLNIFAICSLYHPAEKTPIGKVKEWIRFSLKDYYKDFETTNTVRGR